MTGILAVLASGGDNARRVNIAGAFKLASSIDPSDAVAGYRLLTSGEEEAGTGTNFVSYTSVGTWLLAGAAGDYEVRATLDSGAITSGTTGTWLALSASYAWEVLRTSVGTTTAELTIEIRDAATLEVLDTASVTLTAEVEA